MKGQMGMLRLLNDTQIRNLGGRGHISPFEENKVREFNGKPVLSYGTGSFGYDITLAPRFKVLNALHPEPLDPKAPNEDQWIDVETEGHSVFILPPNDFVLGESHEYFVIPDNVMGLVLGKSSYARNGVIFNFTPLEPGWEGHITIEIGNLTRKPVLLYAYEGCAQVLFFESGEAPSNGYGDGPYQNQEGITLSKLLRKSS